MHRTESSGSVRRALFAVTLAWAAASPAFAQLERFAQSPPPTANAPPSESSTDWLDAGQFNALLSQREGNGDYPIEIEGRDVDGKLSFRAKFARQPAEKFFTFEAHEGLSSFEYENIGTMLEMECYHAIHTHMYEDRLGQKRYCGVWVRTFPMLVRALATSQDDLQRMRTVQVLLDLGDDDVEVHGVLLRTLKRCNSDAVRAAVAHAITLCRADPDRSVEALAAALKSDSSPQVRCAAAKSLGQFPDHASVSVPLLLDELESDNQAMHAAAASALAQIYRRVGILEHLQVDPADSQRVVALLVRLLKTRIPEKDGQGAAENALPPNGAAGVQVVLLEPGKMLWLEPENLPRGDTTEYLRAGVIRDLAVLGTDAASAVPDVLAALETDPSSMVRNAAARALGQLAPNNPKVVSALTKAMEDDKPGRASCVQALQDIGLPSQAGIPAVMRVFNDSRNRALRGELIRLLAILGAESPEAATTLLDIYRAEEDLTLRAQAAAALAAVAPSTTQDGLKPVDVCFAQAMEQLAATDPFEKAEAVRVLGILGPRAEPAVKELIEATTHYSFSVQSAAVTSLSQIGPAAPEAVPAIAALLQEKTWRLIPPVAARALGNMGPLAKDAVPALQECLASSHLGLRDAAAEALRKIEQ